MVALIALSNVIKRTGFRSSSFGMEAVVQNLAANVAANQERLRPVTPSESFGISAPPCHDGRSKGHRY